MDKYFLNRAQKTFNHWRKKWWNQHYNEKLLLFERHNQEKKQGSHSLRKIFHITYLAFWLFFKYLFQLGTIIIKMHYGISDSLKIYRLAHIILSRGFHFPHSSILIINLTSYSILSCSSSFCFVFLHLPKSPCYKL